MQCSLGRADLSDYVAFQMHRFFPDTNYLDKLPLFVDRALERTEYCFSRLKLKGFHNSDGPRFNHLHSDQYAIFLYYLANTAHREKPGHPAADKAYGLNKALNGLDAYYEVELPDIFAVQHPVGTVLGRASYSDYFMAYQNCTVGSNLEGDHPVIGRGVVMYGGSRIIGKTRIGENCLVSNGELIMDAGEIPSNRVLFGNSSSLFTRQNKRNVIREIFGLSAVEELKQALKDDGYQEVESLTVCESGTGNQIIQFGIRSVEVGPRAGIEEVKAALWNQPRVVR